MASIAYRFTFLDVLLEDEERTQDSRAGRASSAPPPGFRQAQSNPDEAAVHAYVRTLPSFVTATSADSEETQADSEEAPELLESQEVSGNESMQLSAGSLGHPVLCKRPCVHMAAGRWGLQHEREGRRDLKALFAGCKKQAI